MPLIGQYLNPGHSGPRCDKSPISGGGQLCPTPNCQTLEGKMVIILSNIVNNNLPLPVWGKWTPWGASLAFLLLHSWVQTSWSPSLDPWSCGQCSDPLQSRKCWPHSPPPWESEQLHLSRSQAPQQPEVFSYLKPSYKHFAKFTSRKSTIMDPDIAFRLSGLLRITWATPHSDLTRSTDPPSYFFTRVLIRSVDSLFPKWYKCFL